MVIVYLIGGLGNQMFQYAAGRRLAYVNNVPLKFDIEGFKKTSEKITARQYALEAFTIEGDFASAEEIEGLKKGDGDWLARPLRRLKAAVASRPKATYIREKHYTFDPKVLNLGGDVYLEGYWQSEKYFKDIEDVIRREFTIKIEPDVVNKRMTEIIKKTTESISIHVRRGDYVSNPSVAERIGACSLDYYRKAVERVAAHTQDPHFFVFSDDPQWVKENLKLEYPVTFVEHNGTDKACEDMRLMSLCKHHIIANSSFSWWGAWLCRNPDKIVIAPGRWFNKKELDTRDLIPQGWIRV